jgi:hypothetical protein
MQLVWGGVLGAVYFLLRRDPRTTALKHRRGIAPLTNLKTKRREQRADSIPHNLHTYAKQEKRRKPENCIHGLVQRLTSR